MRLALFQPDIPQNVGAAIPPRACLNVGLDIIERRGETTPILEPDVSPTCTPFP
jgi:hypothetical protein